MTTMTNQGITAPSSEAPNFHVGVRTRVMLGFAGLMVPAATALYWYGQISPGV